MNYKIEIMKLSEEDGGGYVAIVPKLSGCITDGETPEETLKNAYDAIKCWIETAKEKGMIIPPEDEYKEDEEYSGKLTLRIPKILHKQLVDKAKKEGVSLNSYIQYLISYALGAEEKNNQKTVNINVLLTDKIMQNQTMKWDIDDNIFNRRRF